MVLGVCFKGSMLSLQQGLKMYVSNARAVNETGPDNAYDRKYVELDMSQLFQVPKPSLVQGRRL